jgi:hypothetical protein
MRRFVISCLIVVSGVAASGSAYGAPQPQLPTEGRVGALGALVQSWLGWLHELLGERGAPSEKGGSGGPAFDPGGCQMDPWGNCKPPVPPPPPPSAEEGGAGR